MARANDARAALYAMIGKSADEIARSTPISEYDTRDILGAVVSIASGLSVKTVVYGQPEITLFGPTTSTELVPAPGQGKTLLLLGYRFGFYPPGYPNPSQAYLRYKGSQVRLTGYSPDLAGSQPQLTAMRDLYPEPLSPQEMDNRALEVAVTASPGQKPQAGQLRATAIYLTVQVGSP